MFLAAAVQAAGAQRPAGSAPCHGQRIDSIVVLPEAPTVTGLRRIPVVKIQQRTLTSARLDRKAKTLEDIVTLLQGRLKEAEIAEAVSDPSVRLVDAAILPTWPIEPTIAWWVSARSVSA